MSLVLFMTAFTALANHYSINDSVNGFLNLNGLFQDAATAGAPHVTAMMNKVILPAANQFKTGVVTDDFTNRSQTVQTLTDPAPLPEIAQADLLPINQGKHCYMINPPTVMACYSTPQTLYI
jgi:hypothetical protein